MKSLILALLAGCAATAAAAEDLFVSCDNGLRCFRAPCPSRDIVLLPSGQRYPRTGPRFEGLSDVDRKRLAESAGLYRGTIVLGGEIEAGPPLRIVARRVVRASTGNEAALCRRRG